MSLNNETDGFHDMVIGTELKGAPLASSTSVGPHTVQPFVVAGLAPGTYTFWCPISDHAALGMVGTLTISP